MKAILKSKSRIKQLGILGFAFIVIEEKLGIRLPIGTKLLWSYSIASELEFWDMYLETKGLQWVGDYIFRLDPSSKLQEVVATLLPKNKNQVSILDVGAGPLTYLGKRYKNIELNIIAVDPLADHYNIFLEKYGIQPIIKTNKVAAEQLSSMFKEDSFDVVFARNSIDHSVSPEKAVIEMIKVVKKNGHILLTHKFNEAVSMNYSGLHQWNFSSQNGDFIISSKKKRINISEKYCDLCKITCSNVIDNDGLWLNTLIYKI
jgi:ubiquinone/menaquinone biosynthesis C-methylase UbiE